MQYFGGEYVTTDRPNVVPSKPYTWIEWDQHIDGAVKFRVINSDISFDISIGSQVYGTGYILVFTMC